MASQDVSVEIAYDLSIGPCTAIYVKTQKTRGRAAAPRRATGRECDHCDVSDVRVVRRARQEHRKKRTCRGSNKRKNLKREGSRF